VLRAWMGDGHSVLSAGEGKQVCTLPCNAIHTDVSAFIGDILALWLDIFYWMGHKCAHMAADTHTLDSAHDKGLSGRNVQAAHSGRHGREGILSPSSPNFFVFFSFLLRGCRKNQNE